MVKLATARECRAYSCGAGGPAARSRWEYINAGVYVFAAVLLVAGFCVMLAPWARRGGLGLTVAAVGLLAVLVVNVHDLVAHVAGIEGHVGLAGLDGQLALVEFAVPAVQIAGTVLTFVALLFFEIQMERGYSHKLEKHGLNLLIAGPAFWCLGSIQNVCQIYERANGHVQILQKSVQIPLLLGSLLFLIGGIANRHDIHDPTTPSAMTVGRNWAWFCLFGSLLFFIAGILNLLKVFKMQQMDGRRLELLRGGAEEKLGREREGRVPLILEESRRKRQIDDLQSPWRPREDSRPVLSPAVTPGPAPAPPPGSYKEAVVSGSNA